MPRIPYPQLTEEQEKAVAANPINLNRMMFHVPPKIRAGMSQMGRAMLWDSDYDTKLRELVILRVGYLSKSAYEENQHRAYGKQEGLTDAQIEAALAPTIGAPLDAREQAVLRFAEDVILNVEPSDASVAEVQKYLPVSQVFETIVIIGNYMMIARIIGTAGIEVDAPGIVLVKQKV